MRFISPTFRLSFSLTLLTLSVLLFGQLLGLLPNRTSDVIDRRIAVTENLAMQLTLGAGDIAFMQRSMEYFDNKHPHVLSAGVRDAQGRLVIHSGDHFQQWQPPTDAETTLTHVQLPMSLGAGNQGRLEVRFTSLWADGLTGYLRNTALGLLLFVAASAFCLYFVFLRRALRELNPSSAIPDRVRTAFDVLAEGVMVLDANNNIVMANLSIARRLSASPFELIGLNPGKYEWRVLDHEDDDNEPLLPWDEVARTGERVTSRPLSLLGKSTEPVTFMVNCAPILDSQGKPRGALATFDDMSEVEKRNRELHDTLHELSDSREKISAKNKELEFLATRDPLTGCLNRRSLFAAFDELLAKAELQGTELTCFMVDIDHFKSVNDRFGHGVGDEVIKQLANVLTGNARGEDLVGRYGGEEFCVVSPSLGIERAMEVGERFRQAVADMGNADGASLPLRITASFGAAHLTPDVENATDLVNRADQALYVAKESGRNRVCRYDKHVAEGQAPAALSSAAGDNPRASSDAAQVPANPQPTNPPAADDEQVRELQAQVLELQAEIERNNSQARQRSLHDDATGLPNRTLLMDRLEQAIERARRYDSSAALLSLEISTVEQVHRVFGAATSERLFSSAVERLSDLIRGTDTLSMVSTDAASGTTLSRIGSNEFGMLLTDLTDLDAVTMVVNRVHRALEEPFTVNDEILHVSANVGISLAPHDTNDAELLLRNAAAARRHASQQGERVNLEFYSDEINEASHRQLRIESLLHRAVANNELTLHYQTQHNQQTGYIIGVEALLRWHNPELGHVSPADFIPVAESCGAMTGITDWVLETACAQLKAWESLHLGDFRVAVNLSAVELRGDQCAPRLLDIIERAGVATEQVEIEITESSVIKNMGSAVKTLRRLREVGVTIALDDFGTGYSSLAHLSTLPLDVVKIDGGFVKDIDERGARTVIESIIAIARVAGLEVLAEGVEEPSQTLTLLKLGCTNMQGYLFSKPLPGDAVTELLLANLAERQASSRAVSRWFGRS